VSQQMTNLATHGTGVAATGASVAPVPLYGDFLSTHGVLILSYAEMMQILASVYVFCLLGTFFGVFKGVKKLYNLIRNR